MTFDELKESGIRISFNEEERIQNRKELEAEIAKEYVEEHGEEIMEQIEMNKSIDPSPFYREFRHLIQSGKLDADELKIVVKWGKAKTYDMEMIGDIFNKYTTGDARFITKKYRDGMSEEDLAKMMATIIKGAE
jgi:hypothetical protein